MTALTIAAAMVPTTALLVGRFGLFRALGVTDTLLPLMAPALLGESPFHVLFYLWAFRRISSEVFDAARLEGLGEIGVYWKVAMPLVKPITLAVAVSSFVDLWGAYIEPLVYLSDPDLFTVPMGVSMLANLDPTNQPLLLAGAIVAMAPGHRRVPRRAAALPRGASMRRAVVIAALIVALLGGSLAACGGDGGADDGVAGRLRRGRGAGGLPDARHILRARPRTTSPSSSSRCPTGRP